jgi:hypothetical protein
MRKLVHNYSMIKKTVSSQNQFEVHKAFRMTPPGKIYDWIQPGGCHVF